MSNFRAIEAANSVQEIVFRPYGGRDVVARCPEDLVRGGIQVHLNLIATTWGPGAVRKYKDACMQSRTGNK